MINNFKQARRKLVALYLLIIGTIVLVFSLLIIYQANDSFSDPAVKTDNEIVVSVAEAEALAQNLFPHNQITESEYEIEQGSLYYTVSFLDESEVKVNLLTGKIHIPEERESVLERLTDDFDEMVGWIGLVVFLLSALFCVYVANKTLAPIAFNIRKQKQFVSDAAHEFRNPLAALHARIESVLRLGTQEFKREVLDDLLQETKHLITMSEGLLALEESEQVLRNIEVLRVREFVDSVIRRLGHLITENRITILTDIGKAPLSFDRRDIETILYNLIHNALKFTPENGTVKIVWAEKLLTVSDTGIGIADEDKAHIFDRFYKSDQARTKEGSGLGLSLVKEIVDRYGAKIDVISTLYKGTTITIRFK